MITPCDVTGEQRLYDTVTDFLIFHRFIDCRLLTVAYCLLRGAAPFFLGGGNSVRTVYRQFIDSLTLVIINL